MRVVDRDEQMHRDVRRDGSSDVIENGYRRSAELRLDTAGDVKDPDQIPQPVTLPG
jgi:hypothetical protein